MVNLPRVPKWIKFIIAVLLLPVCAGAAMALWRCCAPRRRGHGLGAAAGGAACWLVIFLLLPKPMWIYVFGHELTHALWTWLFGGQVKKMKVTSDGGHVVISKTNFVIALAPYFFPLYAVLVVAVFCHRPFDLGLARLSGLVSFAGRRGVRVSPHADWHVLQTRQSDITSQGYLFSAVMIFLGNVCVLLFGIPLLTAQVGLLNALGWWLESTGRIFHWLQRADLTIASEICQQFSLELSRAFGSILS